MRPATDPPTPARPAARRDNGPDAFFALLPYPLVLGLLTAIGPFAIDMYLPALPSIGQSLGADFGAVQMSLTAFFLSLGAGQLVYGPVSDMVGRKAPLYFAAPALTALTLGVRQRVALAAE